MPRGRRKKVSTESIDEKIEQQKVILETARSKYDTAKEELARLEKLRNEMRKEEIMEAVVKSEHSYAEIMAFIKGENTEEE